MYIRYIELENYFLFSSPNWHLYFPSFDSPENSITSHSETNIFFIYEGKQGGKKRGKPFFLSKILKSNKIFSRKPQD